jgi:L-fuculose-phosphate aldolase
VTPVPDRQALGQAISQVCRRLYDRGLVAGPDGNVSVRLSDQSILVTPSGLSKVDVTPDDLVIVNLDGKVLDGGRAPSSELGMHLRIYRRRDDVRAVVHAHPPTATGFAVAGESFMAPVLPEVILQMGKGAVPLVPYATPGTEELPDAMEPFLGAYDAFLLANHGATTVGSTLVAAHQRMESLEHAARILLAARAVGRVNELTAAQANRLRGGAASARIADE